ncbi:hypothetical protein EC968_010157 [Mortierella alpina]|nr:hypothetical protein EC968_010157 [Mortierella alpina]
MGKKKNASDVNGHFVVLPVDDVNMDTEDSASNTQQPLVSQETVDVVAELPFTVVTTKVHKRQRRRAMIEACALPNRSLDNLGDAIQHWLSALATIVGSPELLHLPKDDNTGPVVPFVIFKVLTDAQRTAISRSGVTINMGLDDTPSTFLYCLFTLEHQRQNESRRLILKSMTFSTTSNDVKVVLASRGQVAHITMGL